MRSSELVPYTATCACSKNPYSHHCLLRAHPNSNQFHGERHPLGTARIQLLSDPQLRVPSRFLAPPLGATSPHRHSPGVYRLLALGCYQARGSGLYPPPNSSVAVTASPATAPEPSIPSLNSVSSATPRPSVYHGSTNRHGSHGAHRTTTVRHGSRTAAVRMNS